MGEEEIFNYLMVAAAVIWLIIALSMVFQAMLKGWREGAIERAEYRQRRKEWAEADLPDEPASEISIHADDQRLGPVTE